VESSEAKKQMGLIVQKICIRNKYSALETGIAQWYSAGLGDRGFESREGLRIFLLTTASRPSLGSGIHPKSYPMGTRGSFPGGKAAGA
jgi:hypothetical protein